MTAVEHIGRTTTIKSGGHDLTIQPAMFEVGIVIHNENDDMIVVPADILPEVFDAIARAVHA